MIRFLLITLLLAAWPLGAAGAPEGITTVSLRAGARISEHEPITLSTVADLTGPLAESLALLVLESTPTAMLDGQGNGSISIDMVRELVLRSAEESAVTVRGTACQIRIRKPAVTKEASHAIDEPAIGAFTLRDQITAHLRAMFNAGPDSIRLEFEDRNETLLSTPIEGRVVEVRANGTGRRIPITVAIYQGNRLVTEGTVRVSVTLKRTVAVIISEQPRGTMLQLKHLRNETLWVPVDDTSATPDEALGQMLRRRVRAGETLTAAQLEPPIAIRRGDIVNIRSIVGAAVVRLRARALDDGRIGELIEFEHSAAGNSRADRRRISATVLGPGRALIGPSPLKTRSPSEHSRRNITPDGALG